MDDDELYELALARRGSDNGNRTNLHDYADELGIVIDDEPDLIAWAGAVLIGVTCIPVIAAAAIGLWVWLT